MRLVLEGFALLEISDGELSVVDDCLVVLYDECLVDQSAQLQLRLVHLEAVLHAVTLATVWRFEEALQFVCQSFPRRLDHLLRLTDFSSHVRDQVHFNYFADVLTCYFPVIF